MSRHFNSKYTFVYTMRIIISLCGVLFLLPVARAQGNTATPDHMEIMFDQNVFAISAEEVAGIVVVWDSANHQTTTYPGGIATIAIKVSFNGETQNINAGGRFHFASTGITPGKHTVTAVQDTTDTKMPDVASDLTLAQIEKLQVRQIGQTFVDVGGNNLIVPIEKTREFKAVPDPSTVTFPQNKPEWGGSSGANGSGNTTTVTFYDASSTATDAKSVNATYGNTRTASVIVFTTSLSRNNAWSAEDSLPEDIKNRLHFANPPVIGGPQKILYFVDPDSPDTSAVETNYLTIVELQVNILPSGLHLDLSDFNVFNQAHESVTLTTDGGTEVPGQTTTAKDPPFPGNNIDNTGNNNGDTYFLFDAPGMQSAAITRAEDFLNDPSFTHYKKYTVVEDFTTRSTYQKGVIGPELNWSVSTSVTKNTDGTFTID